MITKMSLWKAIPGLALLLSLTKAQTDTSSISSSNFSIPTSRCASPSGYSDCEAPVTAQFSTCLSSAAGDLTQSTACTIAASYGQLQCIYEDCWNIVYSCEIQEFTALTAYSYGAAGLPYYPAPDDTSSGTCSCNLETVQLAIATGLNSLSACVNSAQGGSSIDGINACTCCAQAGAYAGLYDVCPSVNPEYFFKILPGVDTALASSYSPNFASGECAQLLQQTNCQNDLQYPTLPASLSYLPSLPASTGTETWSNNPGELATPSAEVVTLVAQSGVSLEATAVSADGGGRETYTAAGTASTAGQSSQGSETQSAAAASRSTSGVEGGVAVSTFGVGTFVAAVLYAVW